MAQLIYLLTEAAELEHGQMATTSRFRFDFFVITAGVHCLRRKQSGNRDANTGRV